VTDSEYQPVAGDRGRERQPAEPDLPADLSPAALPGDDLEDGSVLLGLEFADIDWSGREAAGAEIDQCRLDAVSLSRARLRRALIRDAVLDRCDLANLQARDSSMTRVAVRGCRMTGWSFLAGGLRDVLFADCRADLASFAASTFSDVAFHGCKLEQADFGDADLRGARFTQCDLTGAQFSGARMAGARFARCDLSGINGVTSLRGAVITGGDAIALAYTLASALGIVIEDD
jgi:uncharacterized protein YjbI with pentapeptide repeats